MKGSVHFHASYASRSSSNGTPLNFGVESANIKNTISLHSTVNIGSLTFLYPRIPVHVSQLLSTFPDADPFLSALHSANFPTHEDKKAARHPRCVAALVGDTMWLHGKNDESTSKQRLSSWWNVAVDVW